MSKQSEAKWLTLLMQNSPLPQYQKLLKLCGWKDNPLQGGLYPPHLPPETNLNQVFALPPLDWNLLHEGYGNLPRTDKEGFWMSLARVVLGHEGDFIMTRKGVTDVLSKATQDQWLRAITEQLEDEKQ